MTEPNRLLHLKRTDDDYPICDADDINARFAQLLSEATCIVCVRSKLAALEQSSSTIRNAIPGVRERLTELMAIDRAALLTVHLFSKSFRQFECQARVSGDRKEIKAQSTGEVSETTCADCLSKGTDGALKTIKEGNRMHAEAYHRLASIRARQLELANEAEE